MAAYTHIAFIFPGQGSQYPGMAKDFVQDFAVARETLEEADDLLGVNLSKLMLEGPADQLTATHNSQAAIYVASCAIMRVLKQQYPELQPRSAAGLSLGEYTALHASGRLDFANTLQLIDKRGRFMSDACEATLGAMSVILGMDSAAVEEMVAALSLPQDIWVANFNCPGQVVVSGTAKGIAAATAAAQVRGAKRVVPLQVHGAFHSGLMASAQERLTEYVMKAPLAPSEVAFAMNVPGDYVDDLDAVRKNLIAQVTHSVRWEQSVRHMAERGVDLFIEIGCGNTLAPFNKRIAPHVATLTVGKVEQLAALETAFRA